MRLEVPTVLLMLVSLASTLGAMELPKRPFVLANEAELAALRVDLAGSGWKSDLYRRSTRSEGEVVNSGRGIHANADLWLHREIDIPAHGGHFHNFFCVDGDPLTIPPDQRYAPGPYRCPKCGRVYEGERYEAAVRRMVHFWLAQGSRDLALVSALEDKPEYAAKSAEILLKYADAYPGPHTRVTEGGMIFQSLDESMWVIPLAQAYDLIHDRLTDAEQTKIEGFLHTVAGGIQKCGVGGNWGSWHLSAVGVIGYAIGDQELVDWATLHFKKQIKDDLGDDGLWPESVHTYHYFPLVAFVAFAEAAWHAGTDLYHWEGKPGKSLLRMFSAPLPYAYPDLRLPAINDGWFQSFVPPDLYEVAEYRFPDPQSAWVLANGYKPRNAPAGVSGEADVKLRRGGLYAFLYGQEIPKKVEAPSFVSTNFPVLGISILRSSDGSVLTFDYGPLLGHGQPDKMGITLFANQKLWCADYGTPGYGSSILAWYRSTFSHNTVVVDGKGQERTRENKAQLWLGDPLLEAVRSETREAYPGVTHARTVVRVGDYFVIRDQLTSEAEHTYDFYLHGEGDFSLDGKEKGTPVEAPVQWVRDLAAGPPTEALSGRWSGAIRGLAFRVMGSAPITPLVGECPAETGSKHIALLIARQTGKEAEFVAVLYPYRGKEDLKVQRRGGKVVVTHGKLEDILTFPEDEKKPQLERKGL